MKNALMPETEPTKPKKPVRPKEIIEGKYRSETFYSCCLLSEVLRVVGENMDSAELCVSSSYGDEQIRVDWKEPEKPNSKYTQQLVKYDEAMEEYEQAIKEYKLDMKEFKIKQKAHLTAFYKAELEKLDAE